MLTHQVTPETFATFVATTCIAAAHGDTAHKRLEVRVDLSTTPATLRYVVSTEGQEHFFDHLPDAITTYNSY